MRGQTWPSPDQLDAHMNLVSRIPVYKCDECGLPCATPTSLEVHKRRHSGLKPYTCEICNTGFSQIGSMNRHLFKKHNISK